MTTADLTGLLRSSRPVAPDRLRDRVRAIAATADAPSRRTFRLPLPRLRIALPVAVATAVAAAALIAVVRPQHTQTQIEASPPRAKRAADSGSRIERSLAPVTTTQTYGAATSDHAAAGSATAPAPAPTAGRAQDYEAQIGLEVKDDDALSNATKRAMSIAESLGGHILNVQYASGGTGNAELTLRVPTSRVEDAISQLTSLGRITSQQVQIQDLQEQLDRLDQRIATLRRRIAHITALLRDPSLSAERRADLEAERATLQTALRSERRQRSGTAQQAAFATIQLSMTTKEQSETPAPASRFHRSLHELGRVLTWEGIVALYVLAVSAPFAVLGALLWLGTRTRRRGVESRLLARS